MPGTGLPTEPDVGGVLAQPPRMVDAAALSSASAWQSIANSGKELANSAEKAYAQEVHLQQAATWADFQNAADDFYTKARDDYRGNPDGFSQAADQHAEAV